MNDKDAIVLWLMGFLLLFTLAIFLAPAMVNGAINTGIKLGEVIESDKQ
jgi:hypothetical protein